MVDDIRLPGNPQHMGHWLADPAHRMWLGHDALRQIDFFRSSLRNDGGFDVLKADGNPIADAPQELHKTSRMVHSFALAHAAGARDCTEVIEAGLRYLETRHFDAEHGGFLWALHHDGRIANDQKLAYGHVFVLLAAASATAAGFPAAQPLLDKARAVIDTRFWDADAGLLRDEFARDWQPFSDYRGYNSNMHGCEAFLAAYEVTGDLAFLDKAGQILEFFTAKIAPEYNWRVPEHFTTDWQPDFEYQGDKMFRPRGTTPGHSFELARLLLHYWDLRSRPDDGSDGRARMLVETALQDAWIDGAGGFAYTLDYTGAVRIADRYWWPVTEALGALSALIKLEGNEGDETWYRRVWQAAADLFLDDRHGGWFPEVDADGRPVDKQFIGKPDIYHALQADLLPLCPGHSRTIDDLKKTTPLAL